MKNLEQIISAKLPIVKYKFPFAFKTIKVK